MVLSMHHNEGHRLARLARILLDKLGLHLVCPTGVAIGFIQQQARFIYITATGTMQRFKT